jgi:hypothetical protein
MSLLTIEVLLTFTKKRQKKKKIYDYNDLLNTLTIATGILLVLKPSGA